MPSVTLSNGSIDFYAVDDFTDPWKSSTIPIVIFQPGIGRHTDFLYHLPPLLAGRVRFIRRDLRGHGRSSIGDQAGYEYTLDTLVDEMAEFVDKVAGRPVYWIGESTAGMVSIAFARKYPNKLRGLGVMSSPLVLNDAFKKMVSEPYSTQGEALRAMGTVKWQHSRPVSRLGSNQTNPNTNEMGRFSGPEYLKWYDEQLEKHNVEGLAKWCDFVFDVDVSGMLEEIKVPTLVLAPRNSAASPVSLNEEMARRIPDAKMVVIESVGHMIYVDKPEETCKAVLDWVEEIERRK